MIESYEGIEKDEASPAQIQPASNQSFGKSSSADTSLFFDKILIVVHLHLINLPFHPNTSSHHFWFYDQYSSHHCLNISLWFLILTITNSTTNSLTFNNNRSRTYSPIIPQTLLSQIFLEDIPTQEQQPHEPIPPTNKILNQAISSHLILTLFLKPSPLFLFHLILKMKLWQMLTSPIHIYVPSAYPIHMS